MGIEKIGDLGPLEGWVASIHEFSTTLVTKGQLLETEGLVLNPGILTM